MRRPLLALALSIFLLARIIAGEAGSCDWPAKVAIAHVWENRNDAGIKGGWYGDAIPTTDDWLAAIWHTSLPDTTDDALFAFGPGDTSRVSFMDQLEQTGYWQCAGGDFIATYRYKTRQ